MIMSNQKEMIQYQISILESTLLCLKRKEHPDYLAQSEDLLKEKEKMIELASLDLRLSEANVDTIYDYEHRTAEEEYQRKIEQLKNKLLAQVDAELLYYKTLRDGGRAAKTMQSNTRKTRSTKIKDSDLSYEKNVQAKNRKKLPRHGAMFQQLNQLMRDEDAEKDAEHIANLYEGLTKKRKPNEAPIAHRVRCERNRLFYDELILQEGDEISISYSVGTKQLTGFLSDMSTSEILILQKNGTHGYVSVMDLRKGRAVLSLIDVKEAALEQ